MPKQHHLNHIAFLIFLDEVSLSFLFFLSFSFSSTRKSPLTQTLLLPSLQPEGGPAIAYLGLLLRDLLYFADSQKTMLGSNSRLLNFQKQTKIHQYLDDYHPLAGGKKGGVGGRARGVVVYLYLISFSFFFFFFLFLFSFFLKRPI